MTTELTVRGSLLLIDVPEVEDLFVQLDAKLPPRFIGVETIEKGVAIQLTFNIGPYDFTGNSLTKIHDLLKAFQPYVIERAELQCTYVHDNPQEENLVFVPGRAAVGYRFPGINFVS
jgi:hypothetical protein